MVLAEVAGLSLVTAVTLVGLTVTACGGVYWMVRWRAGETPEARVVLVEMREVYRTIVALGGVTSDVFLSGAGHGLDSRLEDLLPRLRSAPLRVEAAAVLESWRAAWAAAGPVRPLAFFGASDVISPADVSDMKMKQLQVESARDGLVRVERALERVNRLQRPLVPPS